MFLRAVVAHQDQNRMSLWNVSMVMAPNLFPTQRHRRGSKAPVVTAQEEMEEAVGGAYLVRLMITHQDMLWTVSKPTLTTPIANAMPPVTSLPVLTLRQVPNFLLTQVRHMTQASNQRWDGLARTRKKLLQRCRNSNWTQARQNPAPPFTPFHQTT